jgi:hypothetical protein
MVSVQFFRLKRYAAIGPMSGYQRTYAVQRACPLCPQLRPQKRIPSSGHVSITPEADMCGAIRDVRCGPIADIGSLFDQLIGTDE